MNESPEAVNWLQVRVTVDEPSVDDAEAALQEAGAHAVTLLDAADVPVHEPDPGSTPMWPQTIVEGLFDADADRSLIADALAEAAAHRPEIKLSIEYKPFEVRNRITLGTMARTLLMCEEVGADNLGVTMDAGHALIAQESPAAELCLAHHKNRLFYVHFNDNDRQWDWDTVPGSVNLWEMIETLYWVRRLGWSGWFAYDVFTRKGDPAEALEKTFEIMDLFEKLLDKFGMDELGEMIAQGDPAPTFATLIRKLV